MENPITFSPQNTGDVVQSRKERRALNRTRLLRTGAEFLSQQSYAATGVDQIIAQAGLTKGTFYHYFVSKEQFALEVVDLYANYFNQRLDAYLLNDATDPLERLSGYVSDSIRSLERDNFKRSCLVGNLSQELGAQDSALVPALEAALAGWQRRVAACLRQAQARAEVASHLDAEELSAFFWMGWEGALLQAKLLKRAEPLSLFFKQFSMRLQ